MERKIVIAGRVDDIDIYYPISEDGDVESIEEDQEAAARALKCSPELIAALVMFSNDIRELVGDDLKDIYEKISD